ncbi:MAG: hypothetical protein HZC47_06725 [Methanobacterium sp.]|uniref:hypothetical protein n=1 Tax=Methanobacterium sp. TaxID=2164 RepID=UPI003D65E796|nr:hypothetical protein [Methanobacterium sp.]
MKSKYELDQKDINIEELAKKALSDDKLPKELMDGILSKDNTTRKNCFETLQIISNEKPEILYPKWDHFHKMFKSKNNYHKYIAVYILADLTKIDKDNKFNDMFEDYYRILAGDKVMTASHVALNSSKIAINKPELQEEIIERLINIENIHQGKQKELLKAYAIESLREIYPEIKDKEKVMKFIEEQLESSSPKTRDLAACFIERCE